MIKPFLLLQKIAGLTLVFAMMTFVSQVGGVILLACWLVFRHRIFPRKGQHWKAWVGTFVAYSLCTAIVVPLLAALSGRVPMPWFATRETPVAPRAIVYCLLNRHYVKPPVREAVIRAAREVAKTHPGAEVHYLDAGFPFWSKFPMLPHLSHADGRKIDLTFFYQNRGKYTWSPSPIGYGVYEAPEKGEPAPYQGKRSAFRWDLPMLQGVNRHRELDVEATRLLVNSLLRQPETEKILLEIHLQRRIKIFHSKLRFQQLKAARHDDHLHYQVR